MYKPYKVGRFGSLKEAKAYWNCFKCPWRVCKIIFEEAHLYVEPENLWNLHDCAKINFEGVIKRENLGL